MASHAGFSPPGYPAGFLGPRRYEAAQRQRSAELTYDMLRRHQVDSMPSNTNISTGHSRVPAKQGLVKIVVAMGLVGFIGVTILTSSTNVASRKTAQFRLDLTAPVIKEASVSEAETLKEVEALRGLVMAQPRKNIDTCFHQNSTDDHTQRMAASPPQTTLPNEVVRRNVTQNDDNINRRLSLPPRMEVEEATWARWKEELRGLSPCDRASIIGCRVWPVPPMVLL